MKLRHDLLQQRRFGPPGDRQQAGEPLEAGDAEVAADRQVLHQPVALAIFGHKHQPGPHAMADRPAGEQLAMQPHLAFSLMPQPEHTLEEFGPAGAQQAIDAGDLAGPKSD